MTQAEGSTKLCECGCGEPAPIAQQDNPTRGYIKGQPTRFVLGHHGRKSGIPYRVEDRGYVTPCWIWMRCLTSNGYGRTTVNGTRTQAHVAYYQAAYGPVPDGMDLDHLCRVRVCVNPDHLEPVSRQVNVQRGAKARLTPELVVQIRDSKESSRAWGRRLGVDNATIAAARRGATWRNV